MPCKAHLVAIDDIGNAFKGRAGSRLSIAMNQLDAPSPWGSSYAKRVMMYVAYPMMKAMESPAERSHWRGAIAAVAAGERYWLAMYNSAGVGQIGAINYDDWLNLPAAFIRAITAHGGRVVRAHFILGPPPAPSPACPQPCAPRARAENGWPRMRPPSTAALRKMAPGFTDLGQSSWAHSACNQSPCPRPTAR